MEKFKRGGGIFEIFYENPYLAWDTQINLLDFNRLSEFIVFTWTEVTWIYLTKLTERKPIFKSKKSARNLII